MFEEVTKQDAMVDSGGTVRREPAPGRAHTVQPVGVSLQPWASAHEHGSHSESGAEGCQCYPAGTLYMD